MTRDELEEMEARMMKLVVHRRSVGAFDVNAEAILIMAEDLYRLVQHLREKERKVKKPDV